MVFSVAKREKDFYLSKVEKSRAMTEIDERMKKVLTRFNIVNLKNTLFPILSEIHSLWPLFKLKIHETNVKSKLLELAYRLSFLEELYCFFLRSGNLTSLT